jgi:hypothetical protein
MIEEFERGTLATFRHADHVRLTWAYLDRYDPDVTLKRLVSGLAGFAASKGHPEKFHYTLTRAWLEIIIEAKRQHPDVADADALLARCPALGDPQLIARYYSHGVLSSAVARMDWVPPDLSAFERTV